MYEIPEILMCVCALLLMGILATRSVRLRALYSTLFMVSVAVITVMLVGVHLLIYVLPPAAIVLLAVVRLSDEFVVRYGIPTTTQLSDADDCD